VSTPPKAYCPICNENGKRVDVITLKAMLDISLLVLQNGPYFYCRTADCPVVYFAADGLQSFSKAQIRVRVYQKEPADGSVLVCYCFRHSPNSIRDEFKTTGQRKVIEEIKEAVEAGKCACEICNPQGSWKLLPGKCKRSGETAHNNAQNGSLKRSPICLEFIPKQIGSLA
jgi:hypothetical protein